MNNQTDKWYKLITIIYIFLIFLFTTVARDICISLKNFNILGTTVTFSFIISFLAMGYYLLFNIKLSNIKAFLGLVIILSILGLFLMGIEFPEEKIHFLEFGFLALLIKRSMPDNYNIKKQYILTLIFTIIIGTMDELLQLILPTRVFDIRDISFNSLAGFMAIAGYECVHNKLYMELRKNENNTDNRR